MIGNAINLCKMMENKLSDKLENELSDGEIFSYFLLISMGKFCSRKKIFSKGWNRSTLKNKHEMESILPHELTHFSPSHKKNQLFCYHFQPDNLQTKLIITCIIVTQN